MEKMWPLLKKGLQEAAEESLGERRPAPHKDWFDEECREAIEEKKY